MAPVSTAQETKQPAGGDAGSDAQAVALLMAQTGFSEQHARFVLAVERGEIPPTGDVVAVDATGREAQTPPFTQIDER
jgi:hypothetical protein